MSRRPSSKAVALLATAALVTGTAALALTAQSATAATTMTQTRTCVDGGGTKWTVRSTWGQVYTASDGSRRVQNDVTGFTTTSTKVTRVDFIIWTYNPNGTRIQDLRASNRRFDFRKGATYLNRDVRNPLSGVGKTKIKVKVGDGSDGKSKCAVVFVQPKSGPTQPQGPPAPTYQTDRVYTTGYTWWDNSPPGSAAIAHPVLHRTAGGVGTYADPITLAVAYSGRTPEFPYGTRFYLPRWKKYFIVEDICGACDRHPTDVKYKIDLWLDARKLSKDAARKCTYANTGTTTAVRNPPRGLPVNTSRIC